MGVPSRSGDPREHNWDRTPTHSHLNLDPRSPGLPRPGCAPGAFPAAVATTESTTGKPSPTPPPPQRRPPPPGIAPPLACSRGVAHFHQGLLVSPVPTPGSRRGSRTSLLPPGQT